jgi:hypothetical protein
MHTQIRSLSHRRRVMSAAPPYLYFDGVNDLIDCGSDASLDDLADNALTVDGWFRIMGGANDIVYLLNKRSAVNGWTLYYIQSTGRLYSNVFCATTHAQTEWIVNLSPLAWYHLALYFDDAGDRKIRFAVNGTWGFTAQTAGVGAIVSDAAGNLIIGQKYDSTYPLQGALAWLRLSDNDRLGAVAGTSFTPPARETPPDVDGNTIELWPMNEGSGLVAHAAVNSPANDGTITGATWMRG